MHCASCSAYTPGRSSMNGAPKHVENVALGSVTPTSVPATFAVEHAAGVPAVLVVADQHARRVGGQRCFARTGKAEEHGALAVWPDVRRAVHVEHAGLGHQHAHYAKDALLDLAGVFAAGS